MNIKAVAENTGLNPKTIRYLEKMGVLKDPLDEDGMFFMYALASVWGREEFIRLQVANLSMARRVRVLFGAGYNKVERYMIHRMLAHYSDKEDGGINTLHISQLVDEVIGYYKLPKSARHELTVKAYQIRKRVCNMRYGNNSDLVAIAKTLTTTRTPPKTTGPKGGGATQRQRFSQEGQNNLFGY